jgi:hypothetical protein
MEEENKQTEQAGAHVLVKSDAAVLQRIISELSPLSAENVRRVIDTVCTFFNLDRSTNAVQSSSDVGPVSSILERSSKQESPFRFSENERPSVKQFMIDKAPTTDIERVACLAYYLTNYRSTPHFKTKDISELNTEAAQRRFSNAAFAVVNATNAGFLVPSVKGCKQLSAPGEQFVLALPDYEAAHEALERVKWRKTGKRAKNKLTPATQN